jgi:RsiW-degrading membrane proteinase PrsW (M82 family)
MIDLLITLAFAFIGGFLPALIWLWFWLREDKAHPEPNKLILKTFGLGMLMVPVAFVLQSAINYLLLGGNGEYVIARGGIATVLIIVVWAGIEELVKYLAARSGGLKNKANDEPIDVPIYLITAALGFAALENMLFLISPILEGNLADAFLAGNMRFIGATLLHVASSALIGIFGSLSYFLKKEIKKLYLLAGFILATVLHAIFNLFIINHNDIAYLGFITVWFFVLVIVLIFEKIKKIKVSPLR